MRRICLFAGYDKDDKIQDYVVYMIKELSKISDVYYMANGKIGPEEMVKIAPYTQMFYSQRHHMRDFGTWQFLMMQLGWEKLGQYDELILCNDSVYGPLFNLEEVFWRMERKNYDFWGMTADYQRHFHVHSYFMVFGQEIVRHEKFQNFWKAVSFYSDTQSCEFELTSLLTALGFVGNSYVRNYSRDNVLYNPQRMLEEYAAPFIKVKSFLPENDYSSGTGVGLGYKIRTRTDYDMTLIKNHIRKAHLPQTLGQKIARFIGL